MDLALMQLIWADDKGLPDMFKFRNAKHIQTDSINFESLESRKTALKFLIPVIVRKLQVPSLADHLSTHKCPVADIE